MTQFVIANNVNTQLAAPASSTDTTLTLASSANLPTLSAGQVMPLVLNDAATGLIYEVAYVTAIAGANLTVTRGQEGTAAVNWSLGDYAYCAPTSGSVATAYGNPNNTFSVAPATQPEYAMQLGQATGRLLGVQIFTANGTYTPGVYNGVTATMVRKRICGGGGGSGGVQATGASQVAISNGGGGGAYLEWIGPAASESVTIGAAGNGGTAGPNAGTAGGNTTAGTLTAVGGQAGAGGGAGAAPYINNATIAGTGGGAIGPAAGGTTVINCSTSLAGYGIAVSLVSTIGGFGGPTPFGGGVRQNPAATAYGVGAGGVGISVNTAAAAGIAGIHGVVIYEEYA